MHVSIQSKIDSVPINIQLQIWKPIPEKVTFSSEIEKDQKGLDVFNGRSNSSGSKVVPDLEYMSTCHTNNPAPITKGSNTEKKTSHQEGVPQELARGISELICEKCNGIAKKRRIYKLQSKFWKDTERSLEIPGFLYRCDSCEKQKIANQNTHTALRTFVDHQVHLRNIHTCTTRQKLIKTLFK